MRYNLYSLKNFRHQHDFCMAHKTDQTKVQTSSFQDQACHKNVKFRNKELTTTISIGKISFKRTIPNPSLECRGKLFSFVQKQSEKTGLIPSADFRRALQDRVPKLGFRRLIIKAHWLSQVNPRWKFYLEISVNDVICVDMFQTVEYLGDAATVAERILTGGF